MSAVGGFRRLLAAQRPRDLRGRLLGEAHTLIGHWTLDQEGWEELYNLRRDPLELNDMLLDHRALMQDFRARLKEYVDSGWCITRGALAALLPESY